ncbi:hypothetical protein OCU04_003841 [Sclerotinia nivalis]|uniref:Heterokaryon incompatibility domain-containing protein n=1 Tax=Sclerotinia nivalis TaxID=352851 RepID=A0A9X0ATJ4_9HELO|nr:hypothetical protein OCU04_003841 [Sclerotinia nivalis]
MATSLQTPPSLSTSRIRKMPLNDSPPFVYSSLDKDRQEIRLIKLCTPPKTPEPAFIECCMKVVSLDDNIEYCALSYVWGDPTPTNMLIIKGDDGSYSLGITTNLSEALKSLQASPYGTDTYFWIDAICINQKDDIEKSWQVARMKAIFGQAICVAAWLGVSTKEDEIFFPAALTYSEFLVGIWHRDIQALEPEKLNEYVYSRKRQFAELHRDDGIDEKLFSSVARKSWFRRIWILQELFVARRIMFVCGSILCPLERLQLVFSAIHDSFAFRRVEDSGEANHGKLSSTDTSIEYFKREINLQEEKRNNNHVAISMCTEILDMRDKFKNNNQVYSFWDLLALVKAKKIQSTDPRDNIYVLLGLANDAEMLDIQVDYTITPQTCFIRTCKALIHQGHLNTMLWFAPRPKFLQELPSWVPDFSNDLRHLSIGHFELYSYPEYLVAGSFQELSFRFGTIDSQEQLVLHGLVFDRIQDISEPFLQPFDPMPGLRIAFNIVKKMTRHATCQINFNSENVVNTLLFGRHIEQLTREESVDNGSNSQVYRVGSKLDKYWLTKLLDYVTDTSEIINVELLETCGFMMALRTIALQFQRAFITANGSLGIGPSALQPGDIVAVFHGIEIPHILRPADISAETYNLIGSAYVHGIMYGEVKNMQLDECDFRIQ